MTKSPDKTPLITRQRWLCQCSGRDQHNIGEEHRRRKALAAGVIGLPRSAECPSPKQCKGYVVQAFFIEETKCQTRVADRIVGGIGGLTLALALRDQGLEADIYEQADELREVGAAVALSANATRFY